MNRNPRPSVSLPASAMFAIVFWATFTSLRGDDIATGKSTIGKSSPDQVAKEQFFTHRVVPLLREHCYECHSHESGDSSGSLMLDSLAGMLSGGSRGPTIVPSHPDQSLLLRAVLYQDNDLQMPPSQQLGDEAIGTLRQWLADGATVPEAMRGALSAGPVPAVESLQQAVRSHWAYQPPRPWSRAADSQLKSSASSTASVPRSSGCAASGPLVVEPVDGNVVDAIVRAQLAAAGLTLSPQADRGTLLRRLSYDLTGLPPTPAETAQVLSDPRDDAAVVAELIERLIASPSFGERWARFWMDVSRYADNKGYVFQEDREYPGAHQYRSWLIRAFNQDLPYDQFVTQQLAADLIASPANHTTPTQPSDSQLAESQSSESQSGESQPSASPLTASSAGDLPALGFLTLGRRFLNNRLDIVDDRLDVVTRGLMGMTLACARCHDHKFDPLTQADYYAMSGVFYNTDEPGGDPWPHRLVDSSEARQAFILIRGSPGRHGDEVPRRFVSLLAPDETPFGKGSGRVELAERIVSVDNPLTARVMANRLWLQLTGSSLIESPSDLGMRAPQPKQLALLDQLALTLSVDQQWSIKSFVRLIVSSRVYQQSSQHRKDCAQVDPENSLYWKMNRRRLEFEPLRDTLLARAGQLDRQLYGPSEAIAAAPHSHRRTVYAYIDRQNLPQVFRTFDLASPDNHTPARAQTSVPQQGLYLLNSDFVAELSQQLAHRSQAGTAADSAATDSAATDSTAAKATEQAAWMFSQVFCRLPSPAEQTLMNDFLQLATADPLDNTLTKSSPLSQLAGALLAANELAYID